MGITQIQAKEIVLLSYSEGKVTMTLYQRGLAALENKDIDQAITCFSEAIRLNPKHFAAYVGRGAAYFERGECDRAIEDFTTAIRLEPTAPVFFNRAFVHDRKGEYDRAINDYSEAIRLDPNFAVAYENRAKAYRAVGEEARAASDERQAQQRKK